MTSVETPNQKILTFLTFSEGAEAAVNLYVSLFLKGYLC
jgi:predicted 3-demethylubiquinone-9 3-methyltransferase (glyoxalase superfamily)